MNKEIRLSRDEAKRIVAELSVVVVSLDQMGGYYGAQNDIEGFRKEAGKFIADKKISLRMANIRKLIDEKLDGILDKHEQREFEDECEKLDYWEGPSL